MNHKGTKDTKDTKKKTNLFLCVLRVFVVFPTIFALFAVSLVAIGRAAPPNEEIAYVSSFTAYRHDLTRGIRHRLRLPNSVQALWLVWSPDGEQLALTVCDRYRANVRAVCSLETVGVVDGTRRQRAREAFGMAWMPDGKAIIYLVLYPFPGLFMIDLESERITTLASGGMNHTSLALSPDGTRLVYTDVPFNGTSARAQIYMLDTADAPAVLRSDETRRDNARLLTAWNSAYSAAWNDNPLWSPDGTQIAFLSTAETFHPEVYVMDVDSISGYPSVKRRSACGDAIYHVWSDDGTRIAYLCNADRSLRVISADGARSERVLATPVRSVAPIWSHDEQSLYFVDLERRLMRVHIDSGISELLTPIPIIDTGEGGRILMRRPSPTG